MKSKAIFKTVRPEVKAVDMATGIIDMLIPVSTPAEDRDLELISQDAWTKRLPEFMKRPILVASHDYYDLRNQIGEFVELTPTESGLLGKPKYYINQGNDVADWAFNLASKGMAAFSVGFIPWAWDDPDEDGNKRYTDNELLEISQVIVPSNREAIQGMRGKSGNAILEGVMNDILKSNITKPEEKHARGISQSEIRDEFDYLLEIIKSGNLNEENKSMASKLEKELRRLSGNDIPVVIKLATRHKETITKAIADLEDDLATMDDHDKAHKKAHSRHKDLLVKCREGLKAMIAPIEAIEKPEEEEEEPEKPEPEQEPAEPEEKPEKSVDIREILLGLRDRVKQN